MRICTVPPSICSNCRIRRGRCSIHRSSSHRITATTAYSKTTSRLATTPDPSSPKNRARRSTAVNSATVATTRIVWPAGTVVRLAPRRIGMTTPSPVADRITAMSDGVCTTSAAPSTDAMTIAMARPRA